MGEEVVGGGRIQVWEGLIRSRHAVFKGFAGAREALAEVQRVVFRCRHTAQHSMGEVWVVVSCVQVEVVSEVVLIISGVKIELDSCHFRFNWCAPTGRAA